MTRLFVTDCEGRSPPTTTPWRSPSASCPTAATCSPGSAATTTCWPTWSAAPATTPATPCACCRPSSRPSRSWTRTWSCSAPSACSWCRARPSCSTSVRALMPAFIISTSYTPYLRALCALAGFPFDDVRCTELHLDAWRDERGREGVAARAGRSASWRGRCWRCPKAPPRCTTWRPATATTVAALDALFWDEMQGRVSGELVAAVRPVGGGMKLEALRRIVADHDVRGDEVMYVGDSITDAPALREVGRLGRRGAQLQRQRLRPGGRRVRRRRARTRMWWRTWPRPSPRAAARQCCWP